MIRNGPGVVGLGLFLAINSSGEDRLYIPFLERESQSNVTVIASEWGGKEVPCPIELTNSVSNTNLFTPQEQKRLLDIFEKYKTVTTNTGPPDAILVSAYKTNFVYWVTNQPYWITNHFAPRWATNNTWVVNLEYPKTGAHEAVKINHGISATYWSKSNEGYDINITRVGGGSLLTYTEFKDDKRCGILARFEDEKPQGTNWDYRRADFKSGDLVEYMQTTNRMMLGKWLMWRGRTGTLTLEAESKVPYDWNNHRIINWPFSATH